MHIWIGTTYKSKIQSAYRSGHSTDTALLRILNDLLTIADGGNNAGLVLLDLSVAFDTTDHALLLQRLRNDISLHKTVLSWFTSYLADRSQQVLVKQPFSHESPLFVVFYRVRSSELSCYLVHKTASHCHTDICCRLYIFFAGDYEFYSCLPTDQEAAVSAIKNIESCRSDSKRRRRRRRRRRRKEKGWSRTSWNSMSRRLKCSSLDQQPEGITYQWTAFQRVMLQFYFQASQNSRKAPWLWSVFQRSHFLYCQGLFLSCEGF